MLLQDVKLGIRRLWKDPVFTLTAAATLGLGIGANVAVFSVVYTVLLEPLPYDEDRLAFLWSDLPELGVTGERSSVLDLEDWERQSGRIESVALFDPMSVTLMGGDEPVRAEAAAVSANFFSTLGASPRLGRPFSAQEFDRAEQVAIISHALWQTRFGGDPNVLEREIRAVHADEVPARIIGVMPPEFGFPSPDTQVWMPASVFEFWNRRREDRGSRDWMALVRRTPGASLEAVEAELRTIATRLNELRPQSEARVEPRLTSLRLQLAGRETRDGLLALTAAVACVFLIACANLAALALARYSLRRREGALRSALGAGRGRITAQLLVEQLVLAVVSGAAGIGVAWCVLTLLERAELLGRLGGANAAVAGPALLFALAASLLAVVLFGLAPALRMSRTPPAEALKAGGRSTEDAASRRWREALVAVQFAAAVLLLTIAGLLVRSLESVLAVDPGYRTEGVLLLNVTSLSRASSAGGQQAFYREALARLNAMPGVEEAGLIEDFWINENPDYGVTIAGAARPTGGSERLSREDASAGLFRALDVPLLRGRLFDETDGPGSPLVVVINQAMARRYWPDGDPVGEQLKLGDPASGEPWRTVVGIVGDMRRESLEREAMPQVFVPYTQSNEGGNFAVRTTGDPTAHIAAIRRTLHEVDPNRLIYHATTLEAALRESLARRRLESWLLGLFSVISVALAAVGAYGVLSYSISRRRAEMGVRIALGASSGAVRLMMLRQGIRPVVVGLAIGLAAAAAVAQLFAHLFFGVQPWDPLTYSAASACLLAAALLACGLSARAADADPVAVMRAE